MRRGRIGCPNLPNGRYELTVERDGFDRARVSDNRLSVGLTAKVNVVLKPGSIQQEVTVEATAVQLEQESAALGNVVGVKQIVELPLLGRNPYSLLILAPGVMPKGGAGAGRAWDCRATRSAATSTGSRWGGRSGCHEFTTVAIAHFFLFFNGEQIPQRSPDNILATVPTAAQRAGDFSRSVTANGALIQLFDPNSTVPDPARPGQFLRTQFPGNIVPASRFDPIALRAMQLIPISNGISASSGCLEKGC